MFCACVGLVPEPTQKIAAMEINNGDDDYESNNGDEEDISPYTLRRQPRGDTVMAARTNSSRKK